MSKSQEQPVIIATAAGGKMIAMTARMMSEPWTMVDEVLGRVEMNAVCNVLLGSLGGQGTENDRQRAA